MATISTEQMRFLERHAIPLSKVFDASGLCRSKWQSEMKALRMDVAIGVTPCSKASHTMRTRYGHCIQCGTHHLAFLRRYEESGCVYVAFSRSAKLVKLGSASDVRARIQTLNNHGYGGVADWRLCNERLCDKAGRVEFEAQKILSSYRVIKSYEKQGMTVHCQELFSCVPSCAEKAISTALNSLGNVTRSKLPGIRSIGLFGINPLILSPQSKDHHDRLSGHPSGERISSRSKLPSNVRQERCSNLKIAKENSALENVISIKGRIIVAKLAELMKVSSRELIEDLRRWAIYAERDSTLSTTVALTLCYKHGFKLHLKNAPKKKIK